MMRTGTTYLQNAVFPFFEGLHYIHKKQFFERKRIVEETEADRYLISYELAMDDQWEREIVNMARDFPQAIPIVVLRKHSAWLKSEYKRQLKNGNIRQLDALWSASDDSSLYSKSDLMYVDRIACLQQHFTQEPIVLLYDDLTRDGLQFIERLAAILGASFDPARIDLKPRHTSYGERQLRVLRWVMKYVNINREREDQPMAIFRIQRFLRDIVRYGTLHVSALLPIANKPLIPMATLEQIDAYFQEDWKSAVALAQKNQVA